MPSPHAVKPMYILKPIYQQTENIDLPTCMYKMKSIHQDDDVPIDSSNEMTPAMKLLEQRQNQILSQLEELRNEVKSLSEKVGHKFGDTTSLSTAATSQNLQPIKLPAESLDFVIQCSPSQPSFSPIFIAELLRSRGVTVSTPTQMHSSLKPDFDKNFLDLTGGLKGRVQFPNSQVYFTYIWKEDGFCPSMNVSPSVRIHGDVNIARYLSRLFLTDMYDEKNLEVVADVDRWLENARQLAHGNPKEKDAAMKALNVQLGKYQHVSQENMTIADIATLASLLSSQQRFQTLPKNVKKWFLLAPKNYLDIVRKANVDESWFN